MLQVKQEVFPAFDIDTITVSAGYPGASPDEIEKSIVVAIEDSIRDVDGVKEDFIESTRRFRTGLR